ncbi:MAG: 1-acyl-sn-glycerol-3-phosphate acyltransferase [Deltaproteobacteria bacterium]|nr:MAG: 1-acyl-sn-glycerol-3-phosphate acyltransferase [Deltaproteobacteria bacterium]
MWPTKCAAKVFFWPIFSLETSGRENIPRERAFVLLPKHQRWEDIPLLSLAASRPVHYVARYDLFENPLSNWFLRSLGGIPLNRQRPIESRRSIQAVIECLSSGEGVAVFPEGTYYRNKMGPGRAGIVKLMLSRIDLPFEPVGINYSPMGLRTHVRIKFGEPVYGNPEVSTSSFVGKIMEQIRVLSGLS